MSPQSPSFGTSGARPLSRLSRRPRLRYCGIISWRAKNFNARRLRQARPSIYLALIAIPFRPQRSDLGKKSHSVIVAARNWGPRPELGRRSFAFCAHGYCGPRSLLLVLVAFSKLERHVRSLAVCNGADFFFPFGPKSLGSTDHDRPIGDVYRITDRHRIG